MQAVKPGDTAQRPCQVKGCGKPATPKPVYDANPDPAARKQTGQIAVCDDCQARIDAVNERITR